MSSAVRDTCRNPLPSTLISHSFQFALSDFVNRNRCASQCISISPTYRLVPGAHHRLPLRVRMIQVDQRNLIVVAAAGESRVRFMRSRDRDVIDRIRGAFRFTTSNLPAQRRVRRQGLEPQFLELLPPVPRLPPLRAGQGGPIPNRAGNPPPPHSAPRTSPAGQRSPAAASPPRPPSLAEAPLPQHQGKQHHHRATAHRVRSWPLLRSKCPTLCHIHPPPPVDSQRHTTLHFPTLTRIP
jgi:hypothetical protein